MDDKADWTRTREYPYDISGDTYVQFNRGLVPGVQSSILPHPRYDAVPDYKLKVDQFSVKPGSVDGDWARRVQVDWEVTIGLGQYKKMLRNGMISIDLCAMFEQYNLAFDIKDLLDFSIKPGDLFLIGTPLVRYLMPRSNAEGYVGVLRLLMMQAFKIVHLDEPTIRFRVQLKVSCAHLGNTTTDLMDGDSFKSDLSARIEELRGEISTSGFE